MLKKQIFAILLLTIAALAAGYFLMPRQQEVALMQMKDKRFEEALVSYEKQLANGNLSLEVVNRLCELYLQTGSVDKAIEVMEKYIAANPTDIPALEKLGLYYQYAQRQDDYLHNLEVINNLKPKPENLKALSDIYNFNTEYNKQADALGELVKTEQGANSKNFMDLAYIHAVEKDYTEAVKTLQDLKTQYPADYLFPQAELMVTLLFDAKRGDEAVTEGAAWVKAHPDDFENNARMINMLHYRGSPQAAQAVMDQYTKEQINKNPALLEQNILLMLADGKDEEVYQQLKALYASDALTPELSKRLMFFAIVRDEDELAKNLLDKTELKTFNEAELVSLVEASVTQNAPWALKKVTETFPAAQYEGTYPVLMALLAVSNKDKDADVRLNNLDNVELSSGQLLQVARICTRTGKYACTERFLNKMPPIKDLTDIEVADMASLYLDLKQVDKGYTFITAASEGRNSTDIDKVMVKYYAARGETEKVESWLTAHEGKVGGRQLADMFYIALNNKRLPTAVSVAEYYNAKENSNQSRSYLAQAYVRTDKNPQAVALLRQIDPMSEDDENNYMMALAKLSKTSPEYRKELTDFASMKLRSNISEKQKMAIVYALVAAKQTDIVMPAIRELALKNGGQWASLYAENLDKLGRHDEARNFWLTLANQSSTSAKTKREIAYTLLNNGYKSDAVSIFKRLVANAKPDSKELKEMLFLWGPRPSEADMQWVESRYMNAPAAEKSGWLSIVGDYSSSASVQSFVARHPEALANKNIQSTYFESMIASGNFAETSKPLFDDAKARKDNLWLTEYADLARDNGFKPEAMSAYQAVISNDPNNEHAYRESGLVAFGMADYSASELLLGQYLQNAQVFTGDDRAYLAYFHYAELLRRNKQIDAAKPYYIDAINNIDTFNLKTADAQSIKAQALVWNGDVDAGLALYDNLVTRFPNDDILRADYIGALTELKQYDNARRLLAKPILNKQADGSDIVQFAYDKKAALVYTLQNNDEDLLIQFSPTYSAELLAAKFKNAGWVNGVFYGYDSLLVSARPGYKIQIDNTQQTMPIIRAVANDNVSSKNIDKQIRLRYELLAARIDVETGNTYYAANRLNELLPEYKDDTQLLGFIANVENYGGNWPQAQQLLKTARELAPANEDLEALDKSMRRLNAANIKLDHEWVKRGRTQEHITTASGFVNATPDFIMGAVIQNDFVDAKRIRRAGGTVGNFNGKRERAEVYALYHTENGQQVKASLYGNNDTVGAGASYAFLNPLGLTTLSGEYHKPYWDFVEGVLDDATRDRVALIHAIRPNNKLFISGGPSYNRYNVDAASNAISTVGIEADVTYRILDAQQSVTLGYGFDGEYERNHKNGTDSNGNISRLFPLRTREIHFVSINTGYEFTEDTYGELLVGYGYDRFGGQGPSAEARLTHELTENLDVQIRAFYGLDNSNTGDNISRIGAYIRWRF